MSEHTLASRIDEANPVTEPVIQFATNGMPIPLELPNLNEEGRLYAYDMGICTYPLDCCVQTYRYCNRCPHLERFWP